MRPSLEIWISDAARARHLEDFRINPLQLEPRAVEQRPGDYYIALLGALFEGLRTGDLSPASCARLGNALAEFAEPEERRIFAGVAVRRSEAALFAASAFYYGGFPASSYVVLRTFRGHDFPDATFRACFELLTRPPELESTTAMLLLEALRRDDLPAMERALSEAETASAQALLIGPDQWIAANLLENIIRQFLARNLRSVLPRLEEGFWDSLVDSFVTRRPPVWEFFPSQIDAVHAGVLDRRRAFAVQMPTGAGKTALCETLLYFNAQRNPDSVGVLLVPFRSLASELRQTVVKRINAMRISARCAYGGTVPVGEEVRELAETRVLIATPEALTGLLTADPAFLARVSLLICDEGHLLDGGSRGIGLELLLSRMLSREEGAPRIVFVSAIVPNVEEIASWLGNGEGAVVRSDYRAAMAEFSVLRPAGAGATGRVDLEMNPHELPPSRYRMEGFLKRDDFVFRNHRTNRVNVYQFGSIKTLAIASARKALTLGSVVVFAANKFGNQGAFGLAEELLRQLDVDLALPRPVQFTDIPRAAPVIEYLAAEFGEAWIGTKLLRAGAILHHGDLPQEVREALEALLRGGTIRFAVCTSTLAEGVNLPIRTLVLYSTSRRESSGRSESLLLRDIKNLVGRAGRAGSNTKGLVICANAGQWKDLEAVARERAAEPVRGALQSLMSKLLSSLAFHREVLSNEFLEARPEYDTLLDGIDATLVDLAAEEIGDDRLLEIAIEIADRTFAARQARLDTSRNLLRRVFQLRASRVSELRASGYLRWTKEAAVRPRLVASVLGELRPRLESLGQIDSPTDSRLIEAVLSWAWERPEFRSVVTDAFRLDAEQPLEIVRHHLMALLQAWIQGERYVNLARSLERPVDELLGIHMRVVTFALQTLVEQGVALLQRVVETEGVVLADAVVQFPEHLRFGVPSRSARLLAQAGVRHRYAAVALGDIIEQSDTMFVPVQTEAQQLLVSDEPFWRTVLGDQIYRQTLADLAS